ncbi:unnamed protein product, partial [Aphanomyces euteiches]
PRDSHKTRHRQRSTEPQQTLVKVQRYPLEASTASAQVPQGIQISKSRDRRSRSSGRLAAQCVLRCRLRKRRRPQVDQWLRRYVRLMRALLSLEEANHRGTVHSRSRVHCLGRLCQRAPL